MPSTNANSLYGKLLRTVQGSEWPAGRVLPSPADINVVLTATIRWQPLGGRVTAAGQITVLASAQKHIFEYRNGNPPPGDVQRISWESRMDRLANEVRWEVANSLTEWRRSENHRRSAQDVAERGYELGMDMLHGFVFFAPELTVRQWNERRVNRGLPAIGQI